MQINKYSLFTSTTVKDSSREVLQANTLQKEVRISNLAGFYKKFPSFLLPKYLSSKEVRRIRDNCSFSNNALEVLRTNKVGSYFQRETLYIVYNTE